MGIDFGSVLSGGTTILEGAGVELPEELDDFTIDEPIGSTPPIRQPSAEETEGDGNLWTQLRDGALAILQPRGGEEGVMERVEAIFTGAREGAESELRQTTFRQRTQELTGLTPLQVGGVLVAVLLVVLIFQASRR